MTVQRFIFEPLNAKKTEKYEHNELEDFTSLVLGEKYDPKIDPFTFPYIKTEGEPDFAFTEDINPKPQIEVAQVQPAEPVVVEPEKIYTEADMDLAKIAAKQEGYKEAAAEFQLKFDEQAKFKEEIEKINNSINALIEKKNKIDEKVIYQIVQLIVKTAKKIAGQALTNAPEAKIMEFVTTVLNSQEFVEKIMLYVSPYMKDKMDELITAKFQNSQILTKLEVKPSSEIENSEDAKFVSGACEITLSSTKIASELEQLIEKGLAAFVI